jgi:hypothetical protein
VLYTALESRRERRRAKAAARRTPAPEAPREPVTV